MKTLSQKRIPPAKPKFAMPGRKGFTLIELLIVIAIVVILAALAFIGLLRAKDKAKGVTCMTNLRQVGTAIISYAVDHNGQLPPLEDRTGPGDQQRGIWTTPLADDGYLPRVWNKNGQLGMGADVWACPECTIVQKAYNGFGVVEGTIFDKKKLSVPGSGSIRIAAIPYPERTWLVGDAALTKDVRTGWYGIWRNPAQWANGHTPAARHGGRINVCMVDGHVRTLTMQELQDGDYTMFKQQ